MSIYPIFHSKEMRQFSRVRSVQDKGQSLFLIYSSRLAEFREVYETTQDILAQEQIWPDQCDYIIGILEPIQKTAGNLAESFSSKNQRAKSAGRNRYSILTNAYHFYDRIDKTMLFIREFRATNQQWSSKKTKLKEIQNSLRQLDSSFNELMKGLDSIKE